MDCCKNESERRAAKLLTAMRSSGEYLSGEEISRELGVTRAAVWKIIKRLKTEGYAFESRYHKGYRFVSAPDRLSPVEMYPLFCGANAKPVKPFDYIYLDEIGSTNDYAKKLASDESFFQSGKPVVIVAESQTKGKGRLGRSWTAPAGKNISLSFMLTPMLAPTDMSAVALVAACSAARAIESSLGGGVAVKWPNDVVVGGKKVCGILTETSGHAERIDVLVVGIGINANVKASDFSPELAQKATSLLEITGAEVDRKKLTAELVLNFLSDFSEFEEEGFLPGSALHTFYAERCVNIGREIVATRGGEKISGVGRAVSPAGGLITETADGVLEELVSGEVSVCGVYGYA